ncbi:MAG: redoxin domain-containing protein [Bernardetiaceae bacterium]
MRLSLFFVWAGFFALPLMAQKGYQISVSIPDFEGEEAYLAYHFGTKQYIRDTVPAKDGKFVFASEDKTLEGGIYLVVLPPNNQFFEIMVSENQQKFSIINKKEDLVQYARFEGSPDNDLFYTYLRYLGQQRKKSEPFQTQLNDSTANENAKAVAQKELDAIGEEVKAYQERLIRDHPSSLPAKIIQLSQRVELPDSLNRLPDTIRQREQLHYYRQHFFDYTDLSDARVVRTPLLEPKLEDYLERLTVRHPDSIIVAIDAIMSLVKDDEVYKFCASHFLNKYAKSKYMGMDAVYAHIALKYYDKGKAFWMKEEDIARIVNNARKLVPLLIGNVAPDMSLKTLDGKPIRLHEVKANYTIIYFWDPDCGICKKAAKVLVEVYEKYKPYNVEIFGICNKTYEELNKCSESVAEKNMTWINTADPYGQGQAHAKYDIRANPTLFILDQDKKIIYKQIGADQIDEILTRELNLAQEE